MTNNGTMAPHQHLDPATTRQLMQLYYAELGAKQAAQAAIQVANDASQQFRNCLAQACERRDHPLPPRWNAQIDFKTGEFVIEAAE
jgi:hypothetical protein